MTINGKSNAVFDIFVDNSDYHTIGNNYIAIKNPNTTYETKIYTKIDTHIDVGTVNQIKMSGEDYYYG